MAKKYSSMSQSNLIADLAYHKYAALIVHMDIGQCIHHQSDYRLKNITKPNEIFSKICSKYLDGLIKYKDKYQQTNRNPKNKDNYSSFLYQPACFVAFGYTDNLAITAMDDLYPTFCLPSLYGMQAQQSCLAFCPTLKSLGISKFQEIGGKKQRVFCELNDICKPKVNSKSAKGKVPKLPFLEKRPLVAVTYFKMHGMAVLGPGLLMQQTTFKVMGDVVRSTLNKLKKGSENYASLMSEDDIDTFCCAFLDPQDWSDMATIMLCRNYSVITSVIKALRNITFKQLYIKEPRLKKAIRCFGLHKKIKKEGGTSKPLGYNHVFWSTYTTLGLTHDAFKKGKHTRARNNKLSHSYNGAAIADTRLNIHCGHFSSAAHPVVEKPANESLPEAPEVKKPDEIAWMMAGQDDFLLEQFIKEEQDFDTDQVKTLDEIINQVKRLFK